LELLVDIGVRVFVAITLMESDPIYVSAVANITALKSFLNWEKICLCILKPPRIDKHQNQRKLKNAAINSFNAKFAARMKLMESENHLAGLPLP
jgi:hypothetical protein